MGDPARYIRQILVPEIGASGQERIEASVAAVGGRASLSNEVAELYARGAGFRAIEPGVIDVSGLAPLGEVRSLAAREVLAGSRAALAAIREAVGMGASGPLRPPPPIEEPGLS
jgi:hypothetical protein